MSSDGSVDCCFLSLKINLRNENNLHDILTDTVLGGHFDVVIYMYPLSVVVISMILPVYYWRFSHQIKYRHLSGNIELLMKLLHTHISNELTVFKYKCTSRGLFQVYFIWILINPWVEN